LLLRDTAGATATGSEERLASIVAGSQKIERLADGIAGYSIALQIEKGAFQLTPLEVLLRMVLAKLDSEIRANDASVTYEKLPRVNGDASQLTALFENLLQNALRHRAQAAPAIQVTSQKRGEEWLFAVRDNGPGVEAAYLKTMFEPFVRLHGRKHAGAGMGLAICRVILERHGGRIWAESKAQGGTALFFTLPAD
jgi:light-regulated signal transduction histidine kinase (bacteriophytochrome)